VIISRKQCKMRHSWNGRLIGNRGLSNGTITVTYALEWPWGSLLLIETLLILIPRETARTYKRSASRGPSAIVELLVLPRDAVLARYMLSSCVCPSVCTSHAGIVPERLNVVSCKQRHTIAQDSSFLTPKIWTKFQRGHPQRRCQIELR